MNKCIKKSFNHLRPYLAKGLPELEVPPVEPLFIEEMAMENNAGAVRIKALFTNMTAKGPSNFTVRDVRSDISVSAYVSVINSGFSMGNDDNGLG